MLLYLFSPPEPFLDDNFLNLPITEQLPPSAFKPFNLELLLNGLWSGGMSSVRTLKED